MSDDALPFGGRRLSASELAAWRAIPTAVISDESGHRGVLAGLRPLRPGLAFAGQALTILVEDIDNGAPRAALAQAWPGAVMLLDARARPDGAVWGGNLIAIARRRDVAAIVVDGNVRDVAELRRSGVAVYSKGVTPRGPVWGGRFGLPIECCGVRVAAGDLIVGDDDGVIAVPLAEVTPELRTRCEARRDRESAATD